MAGCARMCCGHFDPQTDSQRHLIRLCPRWGHRGWRGVRSVRVRLLWADRARAVGLGGEPGS